VTLRDTGFGIKLSGTSNWYALPHAAATIDVGTCWASRSAVLTSWPPPKTGERRFMTPRSMGTRQWPRCRLGGGRRLHHRQRRRDAAVRCFSERTRRWERASPSPTHTVTRTAYGLNAQPRGGGQVTDREGADIFAVAKDGRTPWSLASMGSHNSVARVVIKAEDGVPATATEDRTRDGNGPSGPQSKSPFVCVPSRPPNPQDNGID